MSGTENDDIKFEIEDDEDEGQDVGATAGKEAGDVGDADGEGDGEGSKSKPLGTDEAIEHLQAQRDQLESRVQTAERSAAQERADAARLVNEARMREMDAALASINSEVAEAKRALKEALDAGETDKVPDLQEAVSEKVFERKALERGKESLKQQAQAPQRPTDPVEAVIARAAEGGEALSSRAQAWLRAHPEVVTDRRMNSKAGWVHEEAIAQGLKPDTEEYYAFADEQMGYASKDKGGDAQAPKPQNRARVTPAAPPSRTVPSSTGGRGEPVVRLTRGEAEAAKDGTHVWNYDDPTGKNRFKKGDPIGVQEFARRKKALAEQGAYDKIKLAQ